MTLSDRVKQLHAQLADWPGVVVAVTKNVPDDVCRDAWAAGLTRFGENRVQALQARWQTLGDLPIEWHLIGPLQRNKVAKVTGQVALIHSVDTVALAEKISQSAEQIGITQPVLLQVNWVAESQKHGFSPSTLISVLPKLLALPGITMQGLMWIAPQGAASEQLTQWFTQVADFRHRLEQQSGQALPELSMGMSQDFDIAMRCGATIIRVGSRLFA